MSAAWPHLRALLVALHLVAVVLMAFPAPSGTVLRRSAWDTDTVMGEVRFWTEQLNAVGLELTEEQVKERAWSVASTLVPLRRKILAPFDPYYRYFGTWQSWKMFVAPQTHPAVLQIEVDRGDGFELVYTRNSAEHAWRRGFFDHDRMRAAVFRYAWSSYRPHYRNFARWVARELFEEDPAVQRVRTSYVRFRTLSAARVRAGDKPRRRVENAFIVDRVEGQ